MPGPLFCEGDTVELRPVEESDVAFLQRLVNHPRVRAGIGNSDPISRAEEAAWIESTAEDDDIHLLICVDGDPVGSLGLFIERPTWGTAEVGYSLMPDHWNNGYATDALRRLCAYGFDERRLHKIVGRAYETNPASSRVLEKVGFEQEGVLRREAFVQGEHVDLHRYGLLAEEFDQ
ncbi:GNAT family N-acetyltransferase [Halobacteriaceae archaeon SHR40]|uniref:GNAT family N-acetyltransferase n=1 Tax=Halovenus amylolytica TaxID=2500550 RepID=UPI000FE3889F